MYRYTWNVIFWYLCQIKGEKYSTVQYSLIFARLIVLFITMLWDSLMDTISNTIPQDKWQQLLSTYIMNRQKMCYVRLYYNLCHNRGTRLLQCPLLKTNWIGNDNQETLIHSLLWTFIVVALPLHMCSMEIDDSLFEEFSSEKDRRKIVQQHQFNPKICDPEVSNESV